MLFRIEGQKMRPFRSAQFVTLLIALSSWSAAFAQTEAGQHIEITPDTIKWMSPPGMTGVELAWLIGGGDKTGLYELRVHLAPGGVVPPHTHPDTRCATVLSGELYAGQGSTIDPGSTKKYSAGSFHCVPAGVPHYVFSKDGDVMFQDSGVGPTGTVWLKK
jgi:quercetin dioxygenase-like cupin family protein